MSADGDASGLVEYLGPTWRRGASGRFIVPRLTLGWEVAGWMSRYLGSPSGDGSPFRLTPEQLRLVLWWFALKEDGEFVYRRGVLQRLKGWGKDPLAAALALVELCGPSRLAGWGPDGEPVGVNRPGAWVEVYGVSKESTRTTMEVLPSLFTPQLRGDFQVEPKVEVVRALGGTAHLSARASGHRSAEGGRVTAMILGETQHWVSSNGGHALYETVTNNVTKMNSRFLSLTNAFKPGEDSIAERDRIGYEEILDGKRRDSGILYDSIEATSGVDLSEETLRRVLPLVRGDSTWLNIDAIVDKIMDPASAPANSRRMWLNQIVAASDALVTEEEWRALWVDKELQRGDAIVLGFDGSWKSDATALVAIRLQDGLITPLLIEERPVELDKSLDWHVDRGKVDVAVRDAFRDYDVRAMLCDTRLWESYIADWAAEFGHQVQVRSPGSNAFAWDMSGGGQYRTAKANELLVSSIRAKAFCTGPSKLSRHMRRHVLNVRRKDTRHGVSFQKETANSPKKIDGWAALVAATAAYNMVRQAGVRDEEEGTLSWV